MKGTTVYLSGPHYLLNYRLKTKWVYNGDTYYAIPPELYNYWAKKCVKTYFDWSKLRFETERHDPVYPTVVGLVFARDSSGNRLFDQFRPDHYLIHVYVAIPDGCFFVERDCAWGKSWHEKCRPIYRVTDPLFDYSDPTLKIVTISVPRSRVIEYVER